MSKADTILKKATAFEKLALYLDRRSFLTALAQAQPIMEGQTPTDPKLNPYSDAGWEEARKQEFGSQRTIPLPAPAAQPGAVSPSPAPQTNKPAGFPSINKGQQQALSAFVTTDRLGIPLHRIDGLLGPETRTALEAARKYFTEKSPTNQKLTDQEVLNLVEYMVNSDPAKYKK